MEEWKEYKLGEIFDFNNGLSKGGKFFGHGTGLNTKCGMNEM